MAFFRSLLPLASLALVYGKPIIMRNNAPRAAAAVCCDVLAEALQAEVAKQGESAYTEGQSDYYVGAQTDLTPACRVYPTSTSEVSTIVSLAVENDCQYAVVSGGHMVWAASNIGDDGFTMDLSAVNTFELSSDKSVLRTGPGNRWNELFSQLEPQGLIVVGGRASHVGVAGFLLGGGVSWLSFEHGWGSSNVLGYEVVLSNGTIIEVNPQTHPDLHKALKFGSTNYGIVTRFDLKVVPTNGIWGGSIFYPEEDSHVLLELFADITPKINQQTSAFYGVQLARYGVDQPWTHWAPVVSTAGTQEWPGILQEVQNVGHPTSNTLAPRGYVDLADEILGGAAFGIRRHWWTINIKVDAALLEAMWQAGKEATPTLFDTIPGFTFGLLAQPITVSMLERAQELGGDFSGVDPSDGDQWLLLGSAEWTNAADDNTVNTALATIISNWESMASQSGSRLPFIYPNYASNLQDVTASFGADNVAAMKEVQQRYDPDGLLAKHWRGGYRL